MQAVAERPESFVSTTNACKLCAPLGASLAFRGIAGAVPFLHGSQGCATYMRRYIISHFREPMDIASSSLGEKQAIHGGGPNLKKGLLNVMRKYAPSLIGVATTCLTETIGDDVPMILTEFRREFGDLPLPEIVRVSTPSYSGTHMEGFHAAVRATVEQVCLEKAAPRRTVNIMPGLVSAADLRNLREACSAFGLPACILPDYSETLDGPSLPDYQTIPQGGARLEDIRAMGGALASLELGRTLGPLSTAGVSLLSRFATPLVSLGLPLGLRESDAFFAALAEISGAPVPARYEAERGRLIDAYVDGHKYVSGKRAVIYGEEDLVVGLTAFLAEIGIQPVLVASGGRGRGLEQAVREVCEDLCRETPLVREGADFFDIAGEAEGLAPDLMVGNSKGFRSARSWGIPLVRVGFPIHDRFGGPRIPHLLYQGAQHLFDTVVNALMEQKQLSTDIGYGYI
ncbi:nitrogenase [Desulfovibrio aminophilus]|nr:nitrogenase component 1 [Desulfovibrio aminophilus]MCM0756380.1 nitrogenase [Desulfovibrio aminophilus]